MKLSKQGIDKTIRICGAVVIPLLIVAIALGWDIYVTVEDLKIDELDFPYSYDFFGAIIFVCMILIGTVAPILCLCSLVLQLIGHLAKLLNENVRRKPTEKEGGDVYTVESKKKNPLLDFFLSDMSTAISKYIIKEILTIVLFGIWAGILLLVDAMNIVTVCFYILLFTAYLIYCICIIWDFGPAAFENRFLYPLLKKCRILDEESDRHELRTKLRKEISSLMYLTGTILILIVVLSLYFYYWDHYINILNLLNLLMCIPVCCWVAYFVWSYFRNRKNKSDDTPPKEDDINT
jgi:hypothetical protein